MNPQFKFVKQVGTKQNLLSWMPEEVIMLEIQSYMKNKKFRSFKSYLKYIETTRIQRTSLSINEIASLLNVSSRDAEQLAVHWYNTIGGQYTCYADLHCYYLNGVYEII